jgi:pimeloyl-ACP methyl ester carboxylesterase
VAVIDGLLAGLDDLYFLLRGAASLGSRPLFTRGWGNDAAIDAVIARFRARGRPVEVKPAWDSAWIERNGHRFRDGAFESPVYGAFLPRECATARFRLYMPPQHPSQVVVAVPTRFEEGYRMREAMALRLAERGIGSLLLESPFMGSRRPAYQPSVMLSTFSDFVLMGGAAIEEARSVLQWLQQRDFRGICVTGLSLGGFLAAVAGALAAPPVAIVTFLAPHDGNVVYLDGLSRKLCDWARMQKTCGTPDPVIGKFRAVFEAISLERLPEPAGGSRVIAVAALHDRIVPPDSYRQMGRLWPSCEMRWIRGGHVSSIMRPKAHLVAVLDALRDDSLGKSAGAEVSAVTI